jgi:hypothetical protein
MTLPGSIIHFSPPTIKEMSVSLEERFAKKSASLEERPDGLDERFAGRALRFRSVSLEAYGKIGLNLG